MKNSMIVLGLLTFIISMSSFTFSQKNPMEVIETALSVEKLQGFLAKDEMGELIPLIVVTNDKFSDQYDMNFDGKKIMLFSSMEETDLREDQAYINVKSLKIKRRTATLKFKYDGSDVRIKLRKKDGVWIYQALSVKGKNKKYSHVDITF